MSNFATQPTLTNEDKQALSNLTVPIPSNESKRIEILRQAKLVEESSIDTGFHRFTSLATRLFDMPYSAISFIEIDQIFFQSKVGFELEIVKRNDWFDAYTILPETSEVYVVADCTSDSRFKEKPFVKNNPKIKFYAGAAIIIDDVKVGVLSIMDTQPHNYFGLEDKENLLDLGAAVSQLAKEKLQKSLNLSAERANIVVSMMHHLRTPMTSLNFATSLLCNDIQQIKTDAAGEHNEKKTNESIEFHQQPLKNPPEIFQSFESSFNEINMALNQLNVLVDSSLSLGQAIIKCSNQDTLSALSNTTDPRKNKFSECNLIEYLTDMFHHHLPIHNTNLDVEWIVDTSELARGTHVTFPDAIMLIVISTVSHMSTESNSLGFYFSFLFSDEDDFEYPELINKMLEGKLSIKIFAKDEKMNSDRPSGSDNIAISSLDSENTELLSKQNFLSIDKILRAINGSSREYVDDVGRIGMSMNLKDGPQKTIHEFFIPCKILLNSTQAIKPSMQDRQRLRLYRPPASNLFGSNESGIKVTYENSERNNLDGPQTTSSSIPGKSKEPSNTVTLDDLHASPSASNGALSLKGQSELSKSEPEVKRDTKLLRVLVVEDTIPVQKLLTRWLQNHGCQVTCANNGKIGLEYLTTQVYDIAFVDFLMPVMLGITTMKLFQDWMMNQTAENSAIVEGNKDLLIVGMSATALESEQEEAFNYGMHFFCPKPVSLELLSIVLAAKREFETNEAAVDKICALINTDSASENTMLVDSKEANSAGQMKTDSGSNQDASRAESKEDKNKWILFRSKKGKVHPDSSNAGSANS